MGPRSSCGFHAPGLLQAHLFPAWLPPYNPLCEPFHILAGNCSSAQDHQRGFLLLVSTNLSWQIPREGSVLQSL